MSPEYTVDAFRSLPDHHQAGLTVRVLRVRGENRVAFLELAGINAKKTSFPA